MLGSNVPTIGGYSTGFKFGDDWGCECIQIYMTQSRRWNIKELTQERIKDFKNSRKKSSIKCVIAHIPFLVNLASPNRDIWKKSVNRMIQEISYAQLLGVNYLVLHPGSYCESDSRTGLNRIKKALKLVCQEITNPNLRILLETMSGQGTALGSSFKEIKFILNGLTNSEFIGICLDTAHIFHAGYNILGYERYEKFINYIEELIGLNKIMAIHLNDSKTELGSRVDRHASIGEGKMGLQVFHAFLKEKRFQKIPKILEIPDRNGKSKQSLKFLKSIMRKNYISDKQKIQLNIKEIY